MKKTKRIRRSIALVLMIALMVTMCNFYVSATENDSIYEETRDQVNIKYTRLSVDNDKLSIQVKDDNFIYRYFGNKEQEELADVLERYPESESAVAQKIQGGEDICAISYTETPICIYEDHLERVKKETKPSLLMHIVSAFIPTAYAAQTQSGTTAYGAEQNFALFTMVSKQTDGTYITSSWATWERGSWIGGANFPASGHDYLLQAVPDSFSRQSHNFMCLYNTSGSPDLTSSAYNGTEGIHYTIMNGGNTYLQVELKDDPLGFGRLSMCILSTTQRSNSSGLKTVNSYYIHTWKELDISVSISAHSSKEASLTITPSISEKSWQVYSYVTFNF